MKTRQIILYRKPTINTRSGARIRTRSIILACTSKYKYIRKRRLCAENGLPSSVLGLCQVCCMLYRGVPLYLLPLAAAAAAVVCSNAIIICASNIRSHRQNELLSSCAAPFRCRLCDHIMSSHVLPATTAYDTPATPAHIQKRLAGNGHHDSAQQQHRIFVFEFWDALVILFLNRYPDTTNSIVSSRNTTKKAHSLPGYRVLYLRYHGTVRRWWHHSGTRSKKKLWNFRPTVKFFNSFRSEKNYVVWDQTFHMTKIDKYFFAKYLVQ